MHADHSPAHNAHRAELAKLLQRCIPLAVMHRWYGDLGASPASANSQDNTVNSGLADLSTIVIAYDA